MSGLSNFDRAHVANILAGDGSNFSALLLRLIAKADADNLERLRQVYPEHVEAFEQWHRQGLVRR